jgi:hypothetical protein
MVFVLQTVWPELSIGMRRNLAGNTTKNLRPASAKIINSIGVFLAHFMASFKASAFIRNAIVDFIAQ